MQTTKKWPLAALVLGGGLALGLSAVAQDASPGSAASNTPSPMGQGGATSGMMGGGMAEMMKMMESCNRMMQTMHNQSPAAPSAPPATPGPRG